jgi:hypothetical protein
MKAVKTAGMCLVLVGMSFAGLPTKISNADRLATRRSTHGATARIAEPARFQRLIIQAGPRPEWPPAKPSLRQLRPHSTRAGVNDRLDDAFMVDTGVVPVPVPYGMFEFSYGAASNGDGWRVFWAEDTLSVYTSGVTSDGAVTDCVGKRVGCEYQSQQSGVAQAIAGTGSGYTAVWAAGENRSIWSARLDSVGNVIDSLLIYDSDRGQALPAIAFDGDSTCLVAWTDNLIGSYSICAARVTAGGRLLDSVPISVAQSQTLMEFLPSIAFGRDVFLVTWTEMDTFTYTLAAKAIRVSDGGVVLDTAIFLRHDQLGIQAYPSVAFGDTCFLAAWAEGLEQPDIYAARVSVSGKIMDTTAIRLCMDPDMDIFSSIVYDGTNYLVMWEEEGDVPWADALCGLRLSADAVPLDSDFIRPRMRGYSCTSPSVSHDLDDFFVACSFFDTTTLNMGVACTRISPEGMVLDSFIALPMSADWHYDPSGAFDGDDFLTVWIEDRGGRVSEVSAARITGDGTVLDPVGFPVDTTLTGKYYTAAAFGDSIYLVAWADNRDSTGYDIYCARIDREGSVLDPGGIAVCREAFDQDYPDISFDGANFLVVWHDNRTDMRGNVYGARISPAGIVLDPGGFAVAASDSFDDSPPAVCFSGADHLVTWQGFEYSVADDNVYGALVSPAGNITRSRFLVGKTSNDYPVPTSVAAGTSSSLVAWVQGDGIIYAARVRADGTVLDTNAVLVDKTDEYNECPHVTSDADGFRVLWDNWANEDYTSYFAVARIDTAGHFVRSQTWFTIPQIHFGSDAVSGTGSDLLVLFSCWTDVAFGQRYSAWRLWGRLGDVPGIEEASGLQTRPIAGGATIVRGVLFLPSPLSAASYSLLAVDGSKVLDLRPGANDVSRLAPGVYFVRPEPSAVSREPSAVTKVVLTR